MLVNFQIQLHRVCLTQHRFGHMPNCLTLPFVLMLGFAKAWDEVQLSERSW